MKIREEGFYLAKCPYCGYEGSLKFSRPGGSGSTRLRG